MRDQATRLRHLAHDLQSEGKRPSSHRVVVCSGKPGVGVSTICENLFELFQLNGYRTVLANSLRTNAGDLNTDVLLFDVNCCAGPQTPLWQTSDEVVLVTTPDKDAVMDTYAAIKLQLPKHQPPKLRLILNQAMSASQTADVHQRLARSCERFLQTEIELLGEVPLDPFVVAAAEKHATHCQLYPQSNASLALEHIAAVMAQRLRCRAAVTV